MTEQSGSSDPSERPGAERPGTERPGTSRSGTERPSTSRSGTDRPRQSSSPPRVDLVGDLQRWLIRQGARNVRKEIGGQVRRSIGGGRTSSADVWDTATNEIPPEVGEAPECQWCPICRAARRMRDNGPGIGGQLSGAGEAVASAVQDAMSALDGLLARTGGGSGQRDKDSRGTSPRASGPHGAAPQGTRPQGTGSEGTGSEGTGSEGTGPQGTGPQGTGQSPWGAVTDRDVSDTQTSGGGVTQPNSEPSKQEDWHGHEPDDRS
jgi:hypothetical protein